MAEFAQLKVELARALEAQTGSQSEQINLAQHTSELVRKWHTQFRFVLLTFPSSTRKKSPYSIDVKLWSTFLCLVREVE